MYFKISQSVNKDGPYKWYWFIHEDNGHIFHISLGHLYLDDCINNLKYEYPQWAELLNATS